MSLLQIATAVLFFYVFGMAAVLMTWYIVKIIKQYVQEGQEEQRRAKKVFPQEDDSVKLRVSGGLLQVNRLPEDEQEKQ